MAWEHRTSTRGRWASPRRTTSQFPGPFQPGQFTAAHGLLPGARRHRQQLRARVGNGRARPTCAARDPLEFRLRHLDDDRLVRRSSRVAQAAAGANSARSAGERWGSPAATRRTGASRPAYEVAQSADASSGSRASSPRTTAAPIVDPERSAQPDRGRARDGPRRRALRADPVREGPGHNGSMKRYRVPRFRDVPPIEVVLLDQPVRAVCRRRRDADHRDRARHRECHLCADRRASAIYATLG